jgi:hypothetical protein
MVLGLTQKSISSVDASKMSGGGAGLAGLYAGGAAWGDVDFGVLATSGCSAAVEFWGGGGLAHPTNRPPVVNANDC